MTGQTGKKSLQNSMNRSQLYTLSPRERDNPTRRLITTIRVRSSRIQKSVFNQLFLRDTHYKNQCCVIRSKLKKGN
jgi:hypothetical protein